MLPKGIPGRKFAALPSHQESVVLKMFKLGPVRCLGSGQEYITTRRI